MLREMGYALFIAIWTLISCQTAPSGYSTNGNVVSINLDDGASTKLMQLHIMGPDIVRVVAGPEEGEVDKASLIILPQDVSYTDFDVKGDSHLVTVTTPEMQVKVNNNDGTVQFLDATGAPILKERDGGGKVYGMAPSGEKGLYRIQQVFDSPEDEAFYGLGQHQHGYMNYKGKDVDLAQHNIVAVVPFLYSNKNYGILWDNYSITKFGDPREYRQIDGLRLFDKFGEAGGLTATYYQGHRILKETKESKIDYQYLETPSYESLPGEATKIVWEGSVGGHKAGEYKFLLYASSYFKLWVDGALLFDKWRQNWNPWSNPFEIAMRPGEKHDIKIEWIPNGGYMSLTCLDPLPAGQQSQLSLSSESAEIIDYYFIKGEDADDVISGYRKLTGKATMLPKWAYGFWQCRERYKTQEELLDVVRTFRKEKIPLDNIVLDWNYWPEDAWGSHEFDKARFPDVEGMTRELHDELSANIMISVWPKYYPGTQHYREMKEHGYLYMNNIEKHRRDWIAQGYPNTFYDVFNSGARRMFWEQLDEHLYQRGFDAWWLDATEPDQHSNLSIDARKENMSPNAMGSGEHYFNAYSLLNAEGIYNGQRGTYPDKRVFILTRSAFAGQQRYAAVTWSGDVAARWSDFRDQISAGINFSMSGIPYWTMDIGGFSVEDRFANLHNRTNASEKEWQELNTRWYQYGAFCPIFRSHGQFPFREIYNISPEGHPAYNSMLYYNRLRYRLMPYIYSVAGMTYHEDYTLMRGLVMDFAHESNVNEIGDQYMFGPSLMVCPVTQYLARQRTVYLPKGSTWYNLNTGKAHKGGQSITANADYERMPVFVRSGAIIPTGPEIQYTNEKPDDEITLHVYAGSDGEFTLYDDEHTNYNYENGAFCTITLAYDDETAQLTIGSAEGTFPGLLEERTFHIVYYTPQNAEGFDPARAPSQSVNYHGRAVKIQLK